MAKFTYRLNIKKVVDNSALLADALQVLADNQLLVGFTRQARHDVTRQVGRKTVTTPGGELTNAAIAYIQEHGSPAHNIPPRPFLLPGVRKAQKAILAQLQRSARAAANGDPLGVQRGLNGAGLVAVSGIKGYIRDGVDPPLAPRTLQIRRAHGFRGTTPLIQTGQLLNGVTYTLSQRRRRSVKKAVTALGENVVANLSKFEKGTTEIVEDAAEAGEESQ
jgi:hypothetical protein